jgi:hypothetical protein
MGSKIIKLLKYMSIVRILLKVLILGPNQIIINKESKA